MRLTESEIKMVDALTKKFIAARERVNTILELNEEYMNVLRTKYGLDDTWVCNDMLTGFEKIGAHSDEDN
jgi:hypothetical protein